ncbi:MAG: phage major tail tube protein [Waddliaceae bacterium]|nr:phage major tail tube protein [Waddliaceae bacterium]
MLPKILKNFSAFVDGRGYAGRVDEITLPKLSIKNEEYRGGGMDVPIDIDLGMEKLEAEITFSEYDPELFRLFGIMDNSTVNFTLRGGLQGTGDAEPVVINLRGKIKELDSGSWKAGDKATLKCMIAIFYYKLTIDRRELIEIDAENMIRKINGVDQLSSMRQALGV